MIESRSRSGLRVIFRVIAALIPMCPSEFSHADGTSPPRFPHAVALDANESFFLYGRQLVDELVFSFAQGVISVNGVPIDGAPEPLPDSLLQIRAEKLRALYAGNALFDSCSNSGRAPRDCAELFEVRFSEMTAEMGRTWRALRDDYFARGDSLSIDTSLVIWDLISDSTLTMLDSMLVGNLDAARRATSVAPSGVVVFTTLGGRLLPTGAELARERGDSQPAALTEDSAFAIVRRYVKVFDYPGPSLVVVTRAGGRIVTGERATRLKTEIELIKADPRYRPSILSEAQAREFRNAD